MDKLAEHLAGLAADEDAKKANAQKEQAAMERSRVGIEYERVERLLANESCYSVTELERDAKGREPWVCWRHIQPDSGPTRIR